MEKLTFAGPVVRDGPNSLSFRNPAALQAIYGKGAHVKKGEWYKTLDISAGAPSVQMVIDQHEHAVRRRVMSPAFSEQALKEAESLIAENARKFCERLGSLSSGAIKGDWTEPKNLNDWATYYGFDFISDLSFGISFGLIESEENRYVPPTLKSASRFLYYVGYLPFAPLIRPLMGTWIMNYVGGQSVKDSLRYTHLANNRLAERAIQERVRQETPGKEARKDVFYYLLNSKDLVTGKGFTKEELQADTSLLIAAGSDGVALVVSGTIFYLLLNRKALEKLSNELRIAFTSISDIRTPKINSLPYLHACVEETLRLCPAKPGSLPREVLCGGTVIDGHHIPEGTNVGVSHYVVHHDPATFPQPWEYRPERWIVDEQAGVTPQSVAAARRAFCPFGIGPMNCIGKNMAYLAAKLALAHLLYQYDIRQAGELVGGGAPDLEVGRRRADEYQMTDYIIGFRDGPMIELKARVDGQELCHGMAVK